MTALLFVFIYAALATSLVACAVRAARYARMPMHLRWEIYPVPHEAGKRAAYGGSRFEDVDGWKAAIHPNHLGEWKAIIDLCLTGVFITVKHAAAASTATGAR